VEHTLKKVEFKQLVVIAVSSTPTDFFAAKEESDEEEDSHEVPLQQSETIATSRPRRQIRKLARFVDMVAYAPPVVEEVSSTFREIVE
ncbi:hypothetical protein PIB30_074765, partial [Stylosanthes scabra]|nr:hypothetical protein [Stylosanthes scabra]